MDQPTLPSSSPGPEPWLEGQALLHELGHGWRGLPNKTLFSLAMGGLRVRVMRSTVTMLSIVLAIAFLAYTGLSSQVNKRLALTAQTLADRGMGGSPQLVAQAIGQLVTVDLTAGLDAAQVRQEAQRIGLGYIADDQARLPQVQRDSERAIDAHEQAVAYLTTLRGDASSSAADLNQARHQVDINARQRAQVTGHLAELQARLTMGRWVRSGQLPDGASTAEMEVLARQTLADRYRQWITDIASPGRLGDDVLDQLAKPLSLAAQAGLAEPARTLEQAVERIRVQRQSESLLNMLRRAGVNIEKTLEGDPMDLWLIVMALLTCAVGIANAMLMSVTERFREIGTMKCLGAQDSLVVKLFLLESAFLGVVGAAGGILIGLMVSLLAALLQFGLFGLKYFPVLAAVPTVGWSVLGGILLSVAGAVYPALAASRMKPVDALRVDE